jgi:hypothetical protein
MLTSLLRRLQVRSERTRTTRAPCRPRSSFRPRLEALEERTALSTLTVLNTSDHDPGSLRAILAAASSGDQIVFDPALSGQTITLTSGELLLNKNLTITGPGAGSLTVSGNNASRVFEVAGGATDSVSGLTVSNGRAAPQGGGILNAGTLTLGNATLSGNLVHGGGGDLDFGGGIYNSGTLTVQNSTVTGNEAQGVPPGDFGFESGYGGGIFNRGALTVTNSTVWANTASVGGGLFNEAGGPFNNLGTVTVSASTLSGNTAYGPGGAISIGGGTVTVNTSTLASNTADDGGGIRIVSGTLTVNSSTLSGNTAYGSYSAGGAVSIDGGTGTVNTCTLAGNHADYEGGGIYNRGTLTVRNSTVAGNSASLVGGIANGDPYGSWPATLNLRNTILAGNADSCGAPDLYGALASSGYNLIGDGSAGDGFAASDLVGTDDAPLDPKLGPLQDNGGPTQTMALLPGSPELQAGDPTQLGTADQRGVVRAGAVDIGAYQASAGASVLAAPATADTAFKVTAAAAPFGQTALGYGGAADFATADTDPAEGLPANPTLSAAAVADGFSARLTLPVNL